MKLNTNVTVTNEDGTEWNGIIIDIIGCDNPIYIVQDQDDDVFQCVASQLKED